jgi:hypothetical protein
MSKKSQENLIRELHSLQCYLQDHAIFTSKIIQKYGKVVVLQKRSKSQATDQNDLVHDYVFFCYTKGTRSLLAANILLTEGLFEDAKIVIRSVYECYINASFAFRNPDKIDDLIELRVGEYFGTYTHPISKKGSIIRKKLIHPITKEVIDFNTSVAKMASNTNKEWDAKVHPLLYSFLSEFTHVHMIASGSYRNDTEDWYSVNPDFEAAYYSIALSAYISWLLFDSALEFIKSNGLVQKTLIKQHQKSIRLLLRIFSKIEFQEKLQPLQESLINRLKSSYFGLA